MKDNESYQLKGCEEIAQYARQDFLRQDPNLNGSLRRHQESNNILGAIFQSDENTREHTIRRNYSNNKC